ncbi:dipeptide ABC transporter ATP-binding protein [Roseisalinus antarcticus]|uniref:Glutathione import ATP-binding protein GsiA n=1 Tax=Roseisalinus antarcticus TaxID=254357 RepID=A0A1Y5T0M7_9RHOB|nr:ABC transporter ATP-binding protein [Roseisalinus antarcticus]SLN53472.1 Glutathione import ATP-binding protein GsiA [Roseisalinus antarcticus]
MTAPLLEIRDLRVAIPTATGVIEALRGVSLSVAPGEVLGIVGESGGGKSMIARTLTHLLPAQAEAQGQVTLAGTDVMTLRGEALRRFRGRSVGLCFQNPRSALNPVRKIGDQLIDRLREHAPGGDLRARAVTALAAVGLRSPETMMGQFPHQLSGGMAQRVMIALSLACNPRLLVADEPTTGLDVTLTGEILTLIARQARDGARGVMIISHDIAALSKVSDRLVVMEKGLIVEEGSTRRIVTAPRHRYTRRLIEAVPDVTTRRRAQPREDGRSVVMAIRDIDVTYPARFGRRPAPALTGVSLDIRMGDTIAVVGESGSGKSTLSRAIMGLLAPSRGEIRFRGKTMSSMRFSARRGLRRYMQMVFQDPFDALNPRMSVEDIVSDPLRLVERDAARRSAAIDRVLVEVGLDPTFRTRRPHELSGGQAQRVGIARALSIAPELVVLDEPASALDVTVQAQLLDLIRRLTERRDRAYLIVSHDLATVRALCDRVVVIDAGRIVEEGPTEHVFTNPASPKTRALLDAAPRLYTDAT